MDRKPWLKERWSDFSKITQWVSLSLELKLFTIALPVKEKGGDRGSCIKQQQQHRDPGSKNSWKVEVCSERGAYVERTEHEKTV